VPGRPGTGQRPSSLTCSSLLVGLSITKDPIGSVYKYGQEMFILKDLLQTFIMSNTQVSVDELLKVLQAYKKGDNLSIETTTAGGSVRWTVDLKLSELPKPKSTGCGCGGHHHHHHAPHAVSTATTVKSECSNPDCKDSKCSSTSQPAPPTTTCSHGCSH
jgi:hypothetical protein